MFKIQLNRSGNLAESYLKIKFISGLYFPSRSDITANPPHLWILMWHKWWEIFLLLGKSLRKKKLQWSLFAFLGCYYQAKIKFISDVNFPSWPDIPVNSHFFKHQSNKSIFKFTCSFSNLLVLFENLSKVAEIMSAFKS